MADRCTRCGGEMRPGVAMGQTYTGSADFAGGEVVTMSPGGPGRLVACLKCVGCGHSVSAPAGMVKSGPAGCWDAPELGAGRWSAE